MRSASPLSAFFCAITAAGTFGCNAANGPLASPDLLCMVLNLGLLQLLNLPANCKNGLPRRQLASHSVVTPPIASIDRRLMFDAALTAACPGPDHPTTAPPYGCCVFPRSASSASAQASTWTHARYGHANRGIPPLPPYTHTQDLA